MHHFSIWISKAICGFAALGFPYCVEAIDGCHINIKAPTEDPDVFITHKYWHLVLWQATIEDSPTFFDAMDAEV